MGFITTLPFSHVFPASIISSFSQVFLFWIWLLPLNSTKLKYLYSHLRPYSVFLKPVELQVLKTCQIYSLSGVRKCQHIISKCVTPTIKCGFGFCFLFVCLLFVFVENKKLAWLSVPWKTAGHSCQIWAGSDPFVAFLLFKTVPFFPWKLVPTENASCRTRNSWGKHFYCLITFPSTLQKQKEKIIIKLGCKLCDKHGGHGKKRWFSYSLFSLEIVSLW